MGTIDLKNHDYQCLFDSEPIKTWISQYNYRYKYEHRSAGRLHKLFWTMCPDINSHHSREHLHSLLLSLLGQRQHAKFYGTTYCLFRSAASAKSFIFLQWIRHSVKLGYLGSEVQNHTGIYIKCCNKFRRKQILLLYVQFKNVDHIHLCWNIWLL